MLRREDKFYIDVLKDFLHSNITEHIDGLNWDVILDHAKKQNTNGIVFYQCKNFLPKEHYQQLNNLYLAEIYAYGKRIALTKEITDQFTKDKIDYFIVKGPIVSLYYPVPALRTMGDTDIVVKEEDLAKVFNIMDELNFTKEKSVNEAVYFKNNMEFEIHHRLIYPSPSKTEAEIALCDRPWEFVSNNELDNSFHFIFLILHLKKHLFGQGAGIRQFLDLAFLIKNTEIDFNFVDKELEKIGYLNFKNVCVALIAKWFDINVEYKEIDDAFYEEATEKILKNGVHGFNNEDNKLNKTFKRLSGNENKISKKNKIKYLKEVFFPKYETLLKMKEYQFVKDRRYLIPLAWLLRIFVSIKNNKAFKQLKKTYTEVFVLRKEMKKKEKEKNEWGL